jgi:hypothetical protein
VVLKKDEEDQLVDRVRHEEALKRVEDRNILQTVSRRKAIWIGLILGRNCFLKSVIAGKIEGRT